MATPLPFTDRVVLVTGAGSILGKACCVYFASQGANVAVNDTESLARLVVHEVSSAGGNAVAIVEDFMDGDKIVTSTVDQLGRLDIIVHAGDLSHNTSFSQMSKDDWETVLDYHLRATFRMTRAVWPHFRKQQFGRIIAYSTLSGLLGVSGQSNYVAAKVGLVGYVETVAKEGKKYNITANLVASRDPIQSGSKQTLVPDTIDNLVRSITVLTQPSKSLGTGSIFVASGDKLSKLRWERSAGMIFKADSKFTPGLVARSWDQVYDYNTTTPDYPVGTKDPLNNLDRWKSLSSNMRVPDLSFSAKIVIVTGAGAGLGRSYALLFASLGAKVVVNDVKNPYTVVEEIRRAGGIAVPSEHSVEDDAAILKTAIEAFGTVHAIVNNAGILRDKSIARLTDKEWDQVFAVHLQGTYRLCKAAWPYFVGQKYGRIVNTCSTSGIYGSFGQANYSAAKMAVLGLSKALALEGLGENIFVNAIAPTAGTQLTATVMPQEVVQALKPEYIAPFVVCLSSDALPASTGTGSLYEVNCGWIGRTRFQESSGWATKAPTMEALMHNWSHVTNFDDGRALALEIPLGALEASSRANSQVGGSSDNTKANESILAAIEQAKSARGRPQEFAYTAKDVVLYNMGVGASSSDLSWVYEGRLSFEALPTFGVVAAYPISCCKWCPINWLLDWSNQLSNRLIIVKIPPQVLYQT